MSKRAKTIYRVSTLKQTEKDDIPMQRQVCREFAEKQGWDIIEEKMEKGISGFKVSAKNRDAILELQEEALNGEFDILLVFMFDRLGRKDDETPFVVEWFVKNGIEVWSATEGEQRFDTHVDKLMNYIRYWQASGESIKTSIRTKTRLGQIVKEGRFKGGMAPYGYNLVKKGRIGKKNKELYDLEINEHEASIVRKIFDLAANKGYGGRRISSTLIEKALFNREGKPFVQSTINAMLGNVAYLGILRSGKNYSDIFPDLQIIDRDTFDRIQEYRNSRRQKDSELKENRAPIPSHGNALLSGIIYCGHCGHKLCTRAKRSNSRILTSDPNSKIVQIYMCNKKYYENKLLFTCPDGQSTYRAEKIDLIIDDMVKNVLNKVKRGNQSDYIIVKYQEELEGLQAGLKHTQSLYETKNKEISVLKEKIIKTLMEDKDTTIFQEMINEYRNAAIQLEQEIKEFEIKLAEVNGIKDNIRKQYTQMVSWADIYAEADLATKKMIIAGIVKKVIIYKGYEIKVELKIDKSQFENGMTFEIKI